MQSKKNIKSRAPEKSGSKAQDELSKIDKIDFGQPRDWLPNSSATVALIFGLVNFGTISGITLNQIAGNVYSSYLVLGLFTLILMAIPMAGIFSVSAFIRYLNSYKSTKSIIDLTWSVISALCFVSAVAVVLKALGTFGALY